MTPQEELDSMTPQGALNLIGQVIDAHLGTKKDHIFLQKAIDVLRAAIAPKE